MISSLAPFYMFTKFYNLEFQQRLLTSQTSCLLHFRYDFSCNNAALQIGLQALSALQNQW